MFPIGSRFYDWKYESEPEPFMNGRKIYHARGKVLGGSSSINGMIFQRGNPLDFERWAADPGMETWDYAHCLPYFKRMENVHGGEAGWRGTDGPLHVTRKRSTIPLYDAFVEAGRQAGYKVTTDYNGQRQEGFGPMEMTIWRGRRWSAANAYLRPALKRRNVQLVRGLARRIVFTGKQATGAGQRHGAVLDAGQGALANVDQSRVTKPGAEFPGHQRSLLRTHAARVVERTPRVPQQRHRRMERVGIEGEDEATRLENPLGLSQRVEVVVRQVMQDAREAHTIERLRGERQLGRVAVDPGVVTEIAPRDGQRSERKIAAGVVADAGGVEPGRLTGAAAQIEQSQLRAGLDQALEPLPQRRPAAIGERVEVALLGDQRVEGRRLAAGVLAQIRPCRSSSAIHGITSSSISESDVGAS